MDLTRFVFSILFIFIQFLCINIYKFGLFAAVKKLGLSSLRLLFREREYLWCKTVKKRI